MAGNLAIRPESWTRFRQAITSTSSDGCSLLSLRVAQEVEKRTGYRMDPRLLFFQTLRQIATLIDAGPKVPGGGFR